MTGGAGADAFRFNTAAEGLDKINDFTVVDDTITVSKAGFGAGLISNTVNAAILANQFTIGSAATSSTHRFIYNNSTEVLFYDADGNGAGTTNQIATLSTGLSLTNADILVV